MRIIAAVLLLWLTSTFGCLAKSNDGIDGKVPTPVASKAREGSSALARKLIDDLYAVCREGKWYTRCGSGGLLKFTDEQKSKIVGIKEKLGAIGAPAIPDLVEAMNGSYAFDAERKSSRFKDKARSFCTEVLQQIGLPALQYICQGDIPEKNIKNRYLNSFVGSLGDSAVGEIMPLLSSQDANTREWAKVCLRTAYSNASKNQARFVRMLGGSKYTNDVTVDHLLFELKSCPDSEVRAACIPSLLEIAGRAPAPMAQKCLQGVETASQSDYQPEVRQAASEALTRFGSKQR
ncbi:MAG: HEAT repeat domain-containing protein [Cyanobacteria bacterium HKST-UBA02]|nr:HEAT repeat domain-containing protein [Cyanobacteria bacterium HKST-UBA02]